MNSDVPDRAVVTWETELPGDSRVDYGLTPNYGVRAGDEEAVQSHRVVLSGLRPGRRYFYRVSSEGSRREGAFVAGVAFVKGPYSQHVTPSEISLLWETNAAVEAAVAYGTAGAPADTVRPEGAGSFREVRLSGLRPGTAYRCRVFAGGVSSPEVGFRTPAEADTAFSFLLYGDSRENPEAHGGLAARMAGHTFDFILHSGDFVTDGRDETQWGPQFFEPVRPIALKAPIYPALGNHEKDAPAYYRYFTVPDNGSDSRPEAWYAFDYGNAHFVVLDTNPVSGRLAAGSEQLLWLERDLEASDARWKIALFHYPLYSSARHKSDVEMRRVLMPLFERYGVDMVLTGHDHCYERTWPIRGGKRRDDGIVQVVSGGGGAELYPVGRSWWTAVSQTCYQYCLLKVSGERLDMDVYDIEGNRIDVLTLHKDRGVLDGLLSAAEEGHPAGQLEAVRELGRTGRLEAAPAVARLAGAEGVDLRRAVAEALARIGSPDGAGALMALSGDGDVAVRRWAMQGLIDLGGPQVAKLCLERLRDPDVEVRRTAARGLQRTPLAAAVPALIEVGREEDIRVRLESVKALAATPGTASGKALIAALSDADADVRRSAFDGIVERKLPRAAVAELADLLGREGPEMRLEVVRVLGEAGDRRALPALMRSLKDGDAGIRQAAAAALGKLKDSGATEALIGSLDDPDRGVRTFVMRALRLITGRAVGSDPGAWKRWWEQR